jgi:hypothetical protein
LFHFVPWCFQPQAGHSPDFVYKEPCFPSSFVPHQILPQQSR